MLQIIDRRLAGKNKSIGNRERFLRRHHSQVRDAVRRGLFHVRLSPAVVAVDLLKVVRVLLEVARSVEYLHERRLLHCDLKLDNVLLKSDVAHDMGFACKLADFGLTKLMNDQ